MPENRKEIAQGKEDLRQIKTLILATIRKASKQPGETLRLE
jgi:hypothetical protein